MLDLSTLKFIQNLLNGADAIKNEIVEEFVDAKRALRAVIDEMEASEPVEGEIVNPGSEAPISPEAPSDPASDAQPAA